MCFNVISLSILIFYSSWLIWVHFKNNIYKKLNQKTKNINVYNLFKHKYNTRIKDKMSLLWNIIYIYFERSLASHYIWWWRLLHKHVMCTKFDIYVFIKERKNLTCNHPPVNFVNEWNSIVLLKTLLNNTLPMLIVQRQIIWFK
jgi:hypothetical protein